MSPAIQLIKVEDLQVKKETIFLDVRSPGEFHVRHIKGSFNVPLDELEEHKEQIARLQEDVVIICKSGNLASKACDVLNKTGLKHAVVLEGGITAWEQANKPLIYGMPKWDIERQVRFVAGLLVFTGALLSLFAHKLFVLLSLFVGVGLVFAALSNTCTMGMLLMKLPYNKVQGHNTKEVVKRLVVKA